MNSREWQVFSLGTLTENFDSRRIPVKEADRRKGPYPYYGASGIVDYVDDYIFDGEYLLIAEDGEDLRSRKTPIAFLANGKFWVNNHAHIVRGNTQANTQFLMYALQTANVSAYLTGSTMPKLTRANLDRIPILAPPIEEQQVTASVLGSLDDKIELNRRMNETLEEMARALFKSWFVDFDPVRAKMEGRQPAGIDEEMASFFPESFEDSSLGEIPKGWDADTLPNVVEVNPRRQLPKGQLAPHLDMQSMPTKGHRPAKWTERELGSGAKFVNGDTLLARITPCLENGKTAFVDFLDDRQVGWGSTEYIVLRPKPPLPPEYAYYLARSDDLRAHAIQNMAGTSGRQRVPAECFNHYLVAVPPEPVARCFGDIVARFMASIRANDEQSRTLAAIRDTLLPKLLSGEIRVREAEEVVEEIV